MKPGQIINSNHYALCDLIRNWGGEADYLGCAADSEASIRAFFQRGRGADIIIPVGGASVGDYDLVKSAFAKESGAVTFEKVAVRPGKPTWSGALGSARVIGLPGNPASAIVTAALFVQPLVRRLAGEVWSAPFAGARPFPDPSSALEFPEPGACDAGLKSDLKVSPGTARTVWPGTVCASGAGGANVGIRGDIAFQPGLYIFDSVNLTVNSTASLIGSGVTFIFANGTTVTMNGGADIQLSAPTSDLDPYQGVLFFGDRDDTGVEHVLNGNSATSFTGALYFPASDVKFSGTNDEDLNACTLLIADEIEFTGNSFFGSDCAAIGVDTAETAQVVLIVE